MHIHVHIVMAPTFQSAPAHKVIITGTGRAGTTFLVRLLTELGLDTGYNTKTWRKYYQEHCQAGLEHEIEDPESPYIVKNPALCESLSGVLVRGRVIIDHALIPVRSLADAANSRIRIGGQGDVPGGLWGTSEPAQQQAALAERFHGLVETLALHDIPHTFLYFPRFAQDADYTYARLRFLLGDMTREAFHLAFARVAQPELIHQFQQTPPVNAGAPARLFAAQRRRQSLRKKIKNIATLGLVIAATWALAARYGTPRVPDQPGLAAQPTPPPAQPSPVAQVSSDPTPTPSFYRVLGETRLDWLAAHPDRAARHDIDPGAEFSRPLVRDTP